MTRVLITGGSSYLGRHLVPQVQNSFDVLYTYFQNDPLQDEAGRQLDLRSETAVSALVHHWQPDVIIHVAGSNRGPNMGDVIRLGTKHITEAAKDVNARLIALFYRQHFSR